MRRMRAGSKRSRREILVVGSLALVVGIAVTVYGATRKTKPGAAPLPAWAPSDRLSARLPALSPQSAPAQRQKAQRQKPVAQRGMRPSAITIPALGVSGSIGVSTVVKGVLIPPRTPTEVGLWAGSADLGAARGEVTIAGHVNWAGMPPFVFGRLAYLVPGDLVYTTDATGKQQAWRVARVYARPKSKPLDLTAFGGRIGPSRLALITCGGAFDARDLSYADNVYAFADPATGE